jgi:polyhydroxyalkanoate synthesis regulator phasin
MAKAKKKTSTIPSFRQIEKQVGRLRKDLEKTAKGVTREAARYIPKRSRRQLNDFVESVNDFSETLTKQVSKQVRNVRADVEDTVFDFRGTVDKRVKAIRKDATERSEKVLDTIEKETRKRVERFLGAIGLPIRSDLDGIKRRVGALERQVEQLVEGSMRRRKSSDESAAA